MSTKTWIKFVISFGLLAIVLIFLGVNYVPSIFASSPANEIVVVAGKLTRLDYIDEQYPRAIERNTVLYRSDYIDELYPRAIVPAVIRFRPDYFDEQYPRAIVPAAIYLRPDYFDEQYPRAMVPTH